jgi:hypothetical protein
MKKIRLNGEGQTSLTTINVKASKLVTTIILET